MDAVAIAAHEVCVSNSDPSPEPVHKLAPTIMMIDEEVVFVGPGPVAFSMTQDAATETLRRLASVLGVALVGDQVGED